MFHVDAFRIVAAPLSALFEPRVARAQRHAIAFLAREAPLICLVGAYVLILAVTLPQQLVQDSWLTLVGGREIVENGLPQRDHLTSWTTGARWVDQQWLGQVVFYALFIAGGIKLVMLVHAGLLLGAITAALSAARLQGASSKATALVGYRLHAFHPTASGWGERSALVEGKVLYRDELIAIVLRPEPGVRSE